MSKYETAVAQLLTRYRIEMSETPTTVRITAAELRTRGRGTAHIGIGVAGICRDGLFLPRSSDAPQMATLTVSAPVGDKEQAEMVRAVTAHLSAHPMVSGSQYDPAFSAEWAAWRTALTELRA